VQLTPDEELEKLIPVRMAIVEVTLNDGTRLTTASSTCEHRQKPMTTAEYRQGERADDASVGEANTKNSSRK